MTITSFTTLGDRKFQLGDEAPLTKRKMAAVDGSELSLESAQKARGLLVVFSCNTCPFVVGNENFPGWERQYNDLHQAAEKAGIGMILINSNEAKRADEDSMEKMKEHAKKMGYTMPYVVDQDSKLANAFGAKTTPHVYLLDANQKLVYCGSIDNTWDTKRTTDINYLADAMDQLKNGTSITTSTTDPRGCSIKRTK